MIILINVLMLLYMNPLIFLLPLNVFFRIKVVLLSTTEDMLPLQLLYVENCKKSPNWKISFFLTLSK